MQFSAPVWLLAITSVSAYYVPESGSDWTVLKPDQIEPDENHRSVPFQFGLVVTPIPVEDDGLFVQPSPEVVTPQTTTVLRTETVVLVAMPTKTADVFQINDGQIQRVLETTISEPTATATAPATATASPSAIETASASAANLQWRNKREDDCSDDEFDEEDYVYAVSCITNATLLITLEDGILRDALDRIGSIVMSRQIQFDGPVPQHGAVYAAGWLITPAGRLTLGNSTVFWQCSSGEFYNLYDAQIHGQCAPVLLDVVKLIEC